MNEIDMAPEIFTVDYVGEPGERTFYLQARGASETYTFLLEKEQVAALADKLRELLVLVDQEDTIRSATAGRDPALSLEEPQEVLWRIGTIGLAYDESGDRVVVLMQPVDEDSVEEAEGSAAVRFALRRDQVRAFVLHAFAIVGEGRPICRLCHLPMDPSGHRCPAVNGHRMEE
ncbi:MAG: DUF3090 family protein [Actinomycetota bacterium]